MNALQKMAAEGKTSLEEAKKNFAFNKWYMIVAYSMVALGAGLFIGYKFLSSSENQKNIAE